MSRRRIVSSERRIIGSERAASRSEGTDQATTRSPRATVQRQASPAQAPRCVCGAVPKLWHSPRKPLVRVRCDGCGTETASLYTSPMLAWDAWHRSLVIKTVDDPPPKRLSPEAETRAALVVRRWARGACPRG